MSLNAPALRHKAREFYTNPLGFVFYFGTVVPLTGFDHSSPIIAGKYEVYQNYVTTHQ